jgi:hypothetical protein
VRCATPGPVRPFLLLAALALALPAGAQEGVYQDGAYGRLDGDLMLGVGAGGGVALDGGAPVGAATVEVRARYLDVAGLVLGFEGRPEERSQVLIAADLRPLFLARFFLGLAFRERYWDVLLDSLGVDLGVALTPLDRRLGVALAVGVGVDVPLVFFGDGVEGLYLRLAGRHTAARAEDRAGPEGGVADWLLMGALVFRAPVSIGLTSWEPERYTVE